MKLTLFFATLALSIAVVRIAMLYLRRTTRRVIGELCKSDASAVFWLRSAEILAYCGSLMLALILGNATTAVECVDVVRTTLILTLGGLFVTVVFVARNVWKTVAPNPRSTK